MNETFAKILNFTLIFWVLMALFSTIFAERMQDYIITDEATELLKDDVSHGQINLLTGMGILYSVMTFQLIYDVPIWITAILDIIFILTGISVVMAVFNR